MNTFRSVTHALIAAAWATGLATSAHAQSTRELDAALLQMSERGDLKDTGAPQVIQKPAQVRYELGTVVDVRAAQRNGLPVLALTHDGPAARVGLKAGDRLVGLYQPGQGATFVLRGRTVGTVADAEFARLFFGIWLSPLTSEPTLRAALLRAHAQVPAPLKVKAQP